MGSIFKIDIPSPVLFDLNWIMSVFFYPIVGSPSIGLLKNQSILQFYSSYRFSLIAYKSYCLHVSLTYDQFHVPPDGNHCIFLIIRFPFLTI